MPAKVIRLNEAAGLDYDQRIRQSWAESLRDFMKASDPRFDTPKKLKHELEQRGVHVSRQAIDCWLAGLYAPRPHVMAVLAGIFGVPTHRIFPIERVERLEEVA